jgi:hypothetical protein
MSTDGGMLGYAELLRLATTNGLQELDCSVVQIPHDGNGNHAVVLAAARTSRGVFRAIGEARMASVPAALHELLLTVAEQRAKTRAMSEAVGMPHVLRADQGGDAVAKPTMQNAPAQPAAPIAQPPEKLAVAAAQESTATVTTQATNAENSPAAAKRLTPEPVSAAQPGPSPLKQPVRDATTTPQTPLKHEAQPGKASNTVPFSEGLGPEVLARLLDMTRRKAQAEGAAITEEEAMQRLDSFFQRAFGHPLSDGSRMEGQRVVQRLASDLARLGAESTHAHAMRS